MTMTTTTVSTSLGTAALGLALCVVPAHAQLRILHPSAAPFAPNALGVAASAPLAAVGPGDPYAFIVRFAKGQRAVLHKHPDTRILTVLKGTLVMGMADGKTVDLVAGTVLLIPAGTPHSAWARDDAVEIVETGTGATATETVTKK
jgi:quercetin dioxygenase-like cupin family protein